MNKKTYVNNTVQLQKPSHKSTTRRLFEYLNDISDVNNTTSKATPINRIKHNDTQYFYNLTYNLKGKINNYSPTFLKF